MRRLEVQIPAPDGRSNGTLHLPDGDGPWPGVLVFPDAGGARETFRQMGDRLAGMGYVALIPDIYYWAGAWAPFNVATLFTDKQERARLSSLMSVLTNDWIIADSGSYSGFLLARPEVTGSAIGTTGYCLGGRMSLIAAGGLGRTIAAAPSFHGGRLAVAGDSSSPHLSADRVTATVYVAGAKDDDSFTAGQAELLERALTDAGVDHALEFYPARYGPGRSVAMFSPTPSPRSSAAPAASWPEHCPSCTPTWTGPPGDISPSLAALAATPATTAARWRLLPHCHYVCTRHRYWIGPPDVGQQGVEPRDAGTAGALNNVSQQLGSALGVALISTFVATATNYYLTHHGSTAVVGATVHGFTVGYWWAAGVFWAGSVICSALIRGGTRLHHEAGQPEPSTRSSAD